VVSKNCPLQPASEPQLSLFEPFRLSHRLTTCTSTATRRMGPTSRSVSIVLLLTTSTMNPLPPLLLMAWPTPPRLTPSLPKSIPRRGTVEVSTS
ncbi:hypothetical protein BC826DRAFT_1058767, partial [Russula brevipes]